MNEPPPNSEENGVEDEYGGPPGRKTRRDAILASFAADRQEVLKRLADGPPSSD